MYINFGMMSQCNNNSHESWEELIEKYQVSDEKQESLNKVKNTWKKCSTKDRSQDLGIWLNKLYDFNAKLKKIKRKHEKYKDDMKAHVFDVLPE